jgi:hypothetical protein
MKPFEPISLKVFEPSASGGYVLTNDESQGFLWCLERSHSDDVVANPIIYKRKSDAKRHQKKEGSFELAGKSREQVESNFRALQLS